MHLCKYQINPCPAEPRYILFFGNTNSVETDQLIGIHSFAFSLRSCQNLAIFAQQYRVKQFNLIVCVELLFFCFFMCVNIIYFEGLMED